MSGLLSGSPGRLDRVKSGGERHGPCPGASCAGSVSCLCRTYSVRRRACPSPTRPQPRGPMAGGRGTWGGIGIRRVSAPMPYGGREAVTPRSRYEYRRQCHGHRPAEGGSPTNRTREHAGGMFEGKASHQSADWYACRSKGLGAQAERWPDAVRTAPSAMPTAAELRQCPLSCFPFFGPVRSVSGGRGKKRLIYEAKTSSTRV